MRGMILGVAISTWAVLVLSVLPGIRRQGL